MDSFSSLYDAWLVKERRANTELETELAKSYRGAWDTGNIDDRYAILCFICDRRDEDGFDLVIEGLGSQDADLALNAAAITFSLISEGFSMGLAVREALDHFAERFPDRDEFRWATLKALDRNETGTQSV